jgi:hypothetical protein
MKALFNLKRHGLAAISSAVALAVAWPINVPASCFLLGVAPAVFLGN